jgi:WhiB family redox-sensing transcriptional regulator
VSATWESLSGALSGIPELNGARCRGEWSTFDETDDPEIVDYALNLCRSCPALAECEQWLQSLLPRKRPVGVVAARVVFQHRNAAA